VIVKRFFAAVMVALTVSACSSAGSGGPSGAPITGGDFHVAWNAQPATLDPVATTATTTRDIGSNIFEGLVALDAQYRPQPVLAQSFQVSPDFTKFDFTLRTNVTFHNGQKMTADDVIASVNRWMADAVTGRNFFAGAKVTSPAPDKVEITTPKPLFTGMLLLADASQPPVVMPASVIANKGPSGVGDIVGTGPYKLVEWRKDQFIHLEKYAGYTSPSGPPSGLAGEKKPGVDNLYYDIVPDASTRLSGLQTGQYQMAFYMSPDHLPQVQSDPNLATSIESNSLIGLVFNKKAGPMSNPTMRQAVQSAVDVNSVLKAGFSTEQFYQLNGALSTPTMAGSYTPAGTEAYNKPDLAKAKQLLQQAGYQGQTLRFLTTHDYDYMYNSAVVVQQQLKAIGVNVDLVVTDWATVLANRAKPDGWDMFITGFNFEPTPAAYIFLQPSWPGWTDDPAIQRAIAAVNASRSDEEAKGHYGDLQAAFYSYAAMVKFGDTAFLTGMQKSVGGYTKLVGPILYNVYKTQT